AWIGVPSGTPMSMPGWKLPHRGPNGLVIGPFTGQMKPAALGVALVVAPVDPSDGPAAAARILASICALAASIATDSFCASSSCPFVARSACALLAFAPASLPWLARRRLRR